MKDLGIWIGIVFPIVIGVITALVLALYAEWESRRLKASKEKRGPYKALWKT